MRGRVYPLTLMKTNLLRYLVQREGEVVARKHLLEAVRGLREDPDTRAVDNFILHLRRYLEDEPSRPEHLLTVRGVGIGLWRGSEIGSGKSESLQQNPRPHGTPAGALPRRRCCTTPPISL